MSDTPKEQTFTVTIHHYSSEVIGAELVFLAVQDAFAPGGRLADFDIGELRVQLHRREVRS